MLWVRLRWRKNLWLCLRADSIFCLSGERVRFPWVGVQSVNWFVSHCGIFGVSFGGFVLFSTGEEEEDPRARV